MWNDRFNRPDYLFGKAPAAFMVAHQDWFKPGLTALLPADGEGRNSVFMAQHGVAVTAFDSSENALAKSRALATEQGVEVELHNSDVFHWDWAGRQFDLVVGIFIQFTPPAQRAEVFAGMAAATAPGGHILLHGYTPKQLDYNTGGPRAVENLYTEEFLRGAFPGFELVELSLYEREIDEGAGHSGMSALADLIVRRPA